MNWPTKIMAPATGVVAAAAGALLMWTGHQPVVPTAAVAICAGLAVGVFFHVFGRDTP